MAALRFEEGTEIGAAVGALPAPIKPESVQQVIKLFVRDRLEDVFHVREGG